MWLWVALTALVVVGGAGTLLGYCAFSLLKQGSEDKAFMSLQSEREGHETQWQASGPKSIGPVAQPNGKNFLPVHYRSPAGELAAYLTPDPNDGKKHPAIVWAHSYSGGIDSKFWEYTRDGHDLTARAFRDKGIVMMCPSWRGENQNPGRIEMLYGELDDLLAAIAHVKRLPYVDPARIYLGGHDVGGTLTLLAACASDQFQAAFSLGGMLDGVAMLKRLPRNQLPFNPDSPQELWLRSPLRYASHIRRPVFYFEARGSFEQRAALQMQQRAGSYFQAFQIESSHSDIVAPVTYLIAEKIAAGQEIRFSADELTKDFKSLAFKASQIIKPVDQKPDDYGLSKILAKVEPSLFRASSFKEEDLMIIRSALKSLTEQEDYSPKAFALVARLADLRSRMNDTRLLQTYDFVLAPAFTQWALHRVKLPAEMNQAEQDCIFTIMIMLGAIPSNFAGADLTAAVLQRDLQPDSLKWYQVFSTFNVRYPLTRQLMQLLADDPPSGSTGGLVLSHVNILMQEGWEGTHPYNSIRGLVILKGWLESNKHEALQLASSTARSSVYLNAEFRDVLIPLALQHPDASVRVHAAWADAKSGGTRGVALLKAACMDVEQSAAAQGLLKNLLLEDEIPLEARDPGYLTKSVVCMTLSQPPFLGKKPLSIDIYAHRDLFWPPYQQKCDTWLLKFTFLSKDGGAVKTGYAFHTKLGSWYALKGNVTSSVPEDIYLRVCSDEFLNKARKLGCPVSKKEAWTKALIALRENNSGMFDALKVPDEADQP